VRTPALMRAATRNLTTGLECSVCVALYWHERYARVSTDMDLLTSGTPIIFSKFVPQGEILHMFSRFYMTEFTYLTMRYAHSPVLSTRTLGHREAARNTRIQSRQATVVYTTQHGCQQPSTDGQPDQD
jgi:hypothetical protein